RPFGRHIIQWISHLAWYALTQHAIYASFILLPTPRTFYPATARDLYLHSNPSILKHRRMSDPGFHSLQDCNTFGNMSRNVSESSPGSSKSHVHLPPICVVDPQKLPTSMYIQTNYMGSGVSKPSLVEAKGTCERPDPDCAECDLLRAECTRLKRLLYGDIEDNISQRNRLPVDSKSPTGYAQSMNCYKPKMIEMDDELEHIAEEANHAGNSKSDGSQPLVHKNSASSEKGPGLDGDLIPNGGKHMDSLRDGVLPKETRKPSLTIRRGQRRTMKDATDEEKEKAHDVIRETKLTTQEDAMRVAELAQLDAQREKEKIRIEYRSNFFSKRYISVIRATSPNCPNKTPQCEFVIPDNTTFCARALPSDDGIGASFWTETNFDEAFDISDSNESVYEKISPMVLELSKPTGRNAVFAVDGFSGSGKSHTMANILGNLGQNLFDIPGSDVEVAMEAFQSLGSDVNSFDLSIKGISIDGLQKVNSSPVRLYPARMFKEERPRYLVKTASAFRAVVSLVEDFREQTPTKNNATSSRTHLVLLFYATARQKTSTLCLIDLAGNERNDALEDISIQPRNTGRTSAINESRMQIYLALEAAIAGIKRVTRDTSVNRNAHSRVLNQPKCHPRYGFSRERLYFASWSRSSNTLRCFPFKESKS
ncbi:P-loop containing nucleoside triphosphate hydrolase protein, partial [Bipolaris maydis]